jgi:acyl phosphate:glycerol-3-phosphate acyltransferase
MTYIILGLLIAYLVGAIPSSVWYGRTVEGIDVREHGSGNAGATNTFRVLGKKAGSIVMAADVLKGYLATSIPKYIALSQSWDTGTLVLWQILFGIVAVLGHIFPVYINFKGGKGVASLLGMVLAINLSGFLACLVIFLTVFLSTGIVSIGSMLAGVTYATCMFFSYFNPEDLLSLKIFGICGATLLIYTHRKNIERLIKGEENRIKIFGKGKASSQS